MYPFCIPNKVYPHRARCTHYKHHCHTSGHNDRNENGEVHHWQLCNTSLLSHFRCFLTKKMKFRLCQKVCCAVGLGCLVIWRVVCTPLLILAFGTLLPRWRAYFRGNNTIFALRVRWEGLCKKLPFQTDKEDEPQYPVHPLGKPPLADWHLESERLSKISGYTRAPPRDVSDF